MESLTTSIASWDDTARFLRVVTWNVAGRVRALPEQAAALAALGADVVCLQEVTVRTEPLWRAALAEAGLAFCESAVALLPPAPTRRRLAVLTAARAPLTRLAAPEVPWPERLVICALDGGPEVINLHSPIAPAPELAKIRTHEALAAYLAAPGRRPARALRRSQHPAPRVRGR